MSEEAKTLEILDESMQNLNNGKVGDIVNPFENVGEQLDITPAMEQVKNSSPENQAGIAGLEANAQKDVTDPTYDPMAGAMTVFGLYGPALNNLIDRMSVRQLKRFAKALVKYPLEGNEVNQKDPVQVEAYKIADKMIQSKFLLILSTAFEEKQRQEMAKKEFQKTQEEAKVLSDNATEVLPITEEVKNG